MPYSDAMIFRFDQVELDPLRFELRRNGVAQAVEPQVLSILLLLAANPDRLISRDELVEKIWGGRIISETAISARIKSARRAIGDDGKEQRLIRTVHGHGFRFVGEVQFSRSVPAEVRAQSSGTAPKPARPSIAVLPFRLVGMAGAQGVLADALADELIAELARLRWLFVIARGSSFRFRGAQVDCRQVGQSLGVRYCLTGGLTFAGAGVSVSVELVDAASSEVLWAETFSDATERLLNLREEIAAHVVSTLEIRIPSNEARIARSKPSEHLDAWSAYHLGLDHMFRFNRVDNLTARSLFERALMVDPQLARACAGLSFTRFQNAFLNYLPDRLGESDAARELAETALHLDQLDPFCQLNMGRALWLSGDLRDSMEWLERATMISPSYAQGVYSKAWAKTLLGEADDGENDALLALRLSPLDPLRYAMLATRALSHVIRGDYEQGAILGERAARSPGAHKHIAIIAAIATKLAGQPESASYWISWARQRDVNLSAADFLNSFPFAPSPARETIERSLADLGLEGRQSLP